MDKGQIPESALAPHQVAVRLQGQIADGITWARRRKAKFRRSASAIRMLSLMLAVGSTIILGLQHLNFWTGLAFSLVAVGQGSGQSRFSGLLMHVTVWCRFRG